MQRTPDSVTRSAKERSWLARLFSKPPLEEKPAPKPAVCGSVYDADSGRHLAVEPSHQGVLDIYDQWRAIHHGTFTDEREMAVFRLFGLTEISERVRELGRNVCPSYASGLDLTRYQGREKEIMDHTASLHLNRAGLDHFGVPVFDFQLLKEEGRSAALSDIRSSIISALGRREGRDTETACAYYIFQGMRMLRLLESLKTGSNDWQAMASAFPNVPVPGPLDSGTDMAETEILELKNFRTYLNKRSAAQPRAT